jgi:3-hydroxyisobutyrate dehydrogenase
MQRLQSVIWSKPNRRLKACSALPFNPQYLLKGNMMKSIAFLGLGAMGSRMAANLIKAGFEVTVWNRNSERAQALVSQGAKVASTPADAARGAGAVISMLRDDEASRKVWLDSGTGALAAMGKDAVAIECSTLTVRWVKELAAKAAGRSIAFLDAPVAGSRPQAEAGQLVFMVGGAADDLQRAQALLQAMGASVQHAGEVGHGAAIKLMVNALFASQVAVMGELLGMSGKLGIEPQRALDVISATPTISPAAKGASMGMLANNFVPMFPVDLVRKDMGYVLQEAHAAGTSLPMIDSVAAVLDAAADAGWNDQNLTVLAKLYA